MSYCVVEMAVQQGIIGSPKEKTALVLELQGTELYQKLVSLEKAPEAEMKLPSLIILCKVTLPLGHSHTLHCFIFL